jgi:hypothetical protein
MASSTIDSGICGFCTTVKATQEDTRRVRLEFETTCQYVENLAEHLNQVDPFGEISYRGEGPQTLRLAAEHLFHPACPVPAGIIKAIEVASGLALPKDASIRPSSD